MPFFDDTEGAALAPQLAPPVKVDVPTPPFSKLMDAAMARENSIGSVAEYASQQSASPVDPSFDPFKNLRGYEDYAASFVDANSDTDVERIKGRIDRERRRAELLDAGGGYGLVAEVIAGVADPVNLLPVGGQAALVGRAGYRAAAGALRVAGAAAVSTVAQEAILQSTQETRTMLESGTKVAGAALLGGILGGGIGAFAGHDLSALARGALAESDAVARVYDRGSVGAAAARDTTLEQETLSSALGAEKALGFMAPTTRAARSDSVETRRVMEDLAELPLRKKKNEEGIASATAVESNIRQWKYPLASAMTDADDLFVQYRMGREKRFGDIARLGVQDAVSTPADGVLTRTQFLEEVGRAMRRGDEHAVPEVAAAARSFRKKLFDPLKDAAIELGLLPKDVDPATATSYLMRVYDHQKLAARPNEFVGKVSSWYLEEQAKKRVVQDTIAPLAAERDEIVAKIKSLEARAARKDEVLGQVEAREEELHRLNKFAYQRSAKMSEPLDQLRLRINEIEARIEPQLAKLRDLSERISAEKDKFPQIREADAAIFKMIGAAQKLRQSKEIVDLVENAEAYSAAVQEVIDGFRGGTREASAAARQARVEMGADELVSLEKQRGKLNKAIKPYAAELRKLRAELADEAKRKGGNARGGAVFETKIRDRGNTLADQAAGREADLATLKARIEQKQARLDALRKEMEMHVAAWEGNTSQAARKAVGRRNAEEMFRPEGAARLRAADNLVDEAVDRIVKANLRLDRVEMEALAYQTLDRIRGTPDGRLPYDTTTPDPAYVKNTDDRRGPLANRVFMIPDHLIEDFLVSDVFQVARTYERSMAPDVELAKRFGRVDMQDQIEAIRNSYAILRTAATTEKEAKRLDDAMKADIRDVAAVRDRLRNVYALPDNAQGMATRAAKVVKDLNYIRLLGGMTLSAIPDIGRAVMQHGLTRMLQDGIVPMLRNWKEFRLSAKETQMAGTALDLVLDSRTMAIADIMDDFGRGNRLERGIHAAGNKFGVVSLMAPWNTALKQIVGVVSQTRSLQAIEALAAGKISDAEMTRLAQFGIDADMGKRIGAEFAAHGRKESGTYWANSGEWTDLEAARVYRAALAKEVDTVIVTPGQEKPLWMSTQLGSVLGQFKSFTMVSTQRVMMAGLQQRDMAALNGAALMVGLGMLSYYLKADEKKLGTTTPASLVKEGIDRSGLTGVLFDVNNIVEKLTRGTVGVSRMTGTPMMTRYASRNAVDALLGPTAGALTDAVSATGSLAAANLGDQPWKAADTHAVRRMVPFQNLLGWRHLFDAAEQGINRALGVDNP